MVILRLNVRGPRVAEESLKGSPKVSGGNLAILDAIRNPFNDGIHRNRKFRRQPFRLVSRKLAYAKRLICK